MAANEGSMGSSNIANQTGTSTGPNIGGTNKKAKIVKDIISKGKTITGKTPDTIILNPVMEAAERTAVASYGRFQPPTEEGHKTLIKKVESLADEHKGDAHIIASHSEGTGKNPIPKDKRVEYLKKIARPSTHVSSSSKEEPSFLHQAKKLHQAGYKHLVWVAGQDRVGEYQKKLNQYNGHPDHYSFKSIKVISAGDRDPDAEGPEGASGTKLRKHAREGNMEAFKKGLAKELHPHAKEIANYIRSVKEEVDLSFNTFVLESAIDEINAVYDEVMKDNLQELINRSNTHLRDDGTSSLVAIYKNDTPGEKKLDKKFTEAFKATDREAVMRSGQDRKKEDLVPRSGQDRKQTTNAYRQQEIQKKIIDEEQIDEISQPVKDRYISRASTDATLANFAKRSSSGKEQEYWARKEKNRKQGLVRAFKEAISEAIKPADRESKGPFAIATKTTKGLRRVPDTRFDTYDSAHKYGMQYHTDKYGSQMFQIIHHPDAKKKIDESVNSAGGGDVRGMGYNSGNPDGVTNYASSNIADANTQNDLLKKFKKQFHDDQHAKVQKEEYETPVTKKDFGKTDHYQALGDLDLNTANRNHTIDEYGYGPINPDDEVGSAMFWKEKSELWNTSVDAAKTARCGNCAAFNQTEAIMKKIYDGLGPEGKKINELADLGFCEIFEFKCAAARTCDAWLRNGPIKEEVNEDLRDWFKDKWVRMDTKGNIKGDCAREPGEGKPKCLPIAKARAMDKVDRARAARRKRREDPIADRPGKGGKPINVQTEAANPAQQAAIAIALIKAGKKKGKNPGPQKEEVELQEISAELVGKVNKARLDKPAKTKAADITRSNAVKKAWLKAKAGEVKEEYIEEKNKPTKPELWSRAKSLARSKFDVYPSAYANGWAAKWYKKHGGGWRSE